MYVKGVRDSGSFKTWQEAAQWRWSTSRSGEAVVLPDKTLRDAMRRYADDVAPSRSGCRWEIIRLAALEQYKISTYRLPVLTGKGFAEWRDARLWKVAPGMVAREMNLLRSVIEYARCDLQWIRANPMGDVRWPTLPKGRVQGVAG